MGNIVLDKINLYMHTIVHIHYYSSGYYYPHVERMRITFHLKYSDKLFISLYIFIYLYFYICYAPYYHLAETPISWHPPTKKQEVKHTANWPLVLLHMLQTNIGV